MGASVNTAARVLSLYRTILRTGRTWSGPQSEKDYIREEAQRLFRSNKHLVSVEEIEKKIFEASSRLELGVHYKIPYPRLHHKSPNFAYLGTPDVDFTRRSMAT
ncbi:hypothetical protein BSKO_01150 [Bryopsis sp. KO-2023]|nr:hypothetical protein BSKO_01150 [Bryopsis sp. KO-2023]